MYLAQFGRLIRLAFVIRHREMCREQSGEHRLDRAFRLFGLEFVAGNGDAFGFV
jgi:hypothetical protein